VELLLVLTMLGAAGLLATTEELPNRVSFFLGMSLASLWFVKTTKKTLRTKHEFKNR